MNQSPEVFTTEEAETLLRHFFQRNGYVRVPDEERRRQLGATKYKKGYEVRLVAKSESELAQMRQALRQIDFKPGKPFKKHNQIVQPVYGKRAVEWFLATKTNPNHPSIR